MKHGWKVLAVVVTAQVVFGLAVAQAGRHEQTTPRAGAVASTDGSTVGRSKFIGALYPVQGTFVDYCTTDCKYQYNGSQWRNLPGASQTFDLPADTVSEGEALITARLSAQAGCVGGSGVCKVRMRVIHNGVTTTLVPDPGSDGLIFDSTGNDELESHAVEQVVPANVGPGTYTVWVQIKSGLFTGSSTRPNFDIRSWTLTTEISYWDY